MHDLIQLFNRYKDGDEDSFVKIYQETSGNIWSYIRKRVHSSKQEDCFQQFWLHLHTKKNLYNGQPVLAWLYVILRNLIIDEYRQNKKILFEDEINDSNAKETLDELLDELPLRDRELIERVHLQGFSYEDLEKEWGLSQTSLRKRLSRGMLALSNKLKGQE